MKITATCIAQLQFTGCNKLFTHLKTYVQRNRLYKVFFFACIILGAVTAKAQWQQVGKAGFSAGAAFLTSLGFSPKDNMPYVAYRDYDKATVMKYNGTSWVTVGNARFSSGEPNYMSLAFSPKDGMPYIAYEDYQNNGMSTNATVMYYTGTQWQVLGTPGFSGNSVIYTSIGFSPKDSMPYVTYSDGGKSFKATVMKFNGTSWNTVGNAGFSAGFAYFTTIAFSPKDSMPYVVYEDFGNSGKATVMKFDGTSWNAVGNAGFSANAVSSTTLAFNPNDGMPYVAFQDGGNTAKATVMKFNGILWDTVGNARFSAGQARYISLQFSTTGIPYVAYRDGSSSNKATVMKLSGNLWDTVGNTGFSTGSAMTTSLALSPQDVPYVAYEDSSQGGRASVMKYVANTITTLPLPSNNLCAGSVIPVSFTATGTYNEGNTFTATLTNWNDPTRTIGTLKGTASGTMQVTLPSDIAYIYEAQHYRIRIDADSPSVNGSDNGSELKIYPSLTFYRDADGDGYGDPNKYVEDCSQPAGYVSDGSDCNDSDATLHSPQTYYVDADNDGYGSATSALLCSLTAPPGYATNNTDCNDSDASVHSPQTYYTDNDKDGYGAGTPVQLCTLTAPVGYSINNTDCNDNDASINPQTVWILDADKDGYYTGNPVTQCASPGTGYVIKTNQVAGDCNDTDATVHSPQTYYVDNDKDGYGSTIIAQLCAFSAPVGYATNNLDCNDNNAAINPTTVWVLDNDKDGYYVGNPVTQCASPGTGYVIKTNQVAGDCNDNDAGVHVSIPYYVDADKDGYGTGAAVLFCSSKVPAGYSANNLDCNDKCATIHPGMTDGYDGIDNDCDGQIDEDFFQLSICDAGMYEGNSGQCYMYFTVSLNWIPCRNITVNYTTQNGTATAGSDYVAKSGTLTFTPGILFQTIAIPVNGDKTVEPNETFQVVLSNPYNATLYKGSGTGTIYNDDGSNCSSIIAGRLKENAKPKVNLSPVPASTYLQVSMSGFTGNVMLQVFDMAGKQLKQQTVQASVATLQQKINVSGFANGSYTLVVSDEAGNRKTEKFIVSK